MTSFPVVSGRGKTVPLLLIAALGLSACGATSGTTSTSTKLSPTQYDNAQRIYGYVVALNKVEAPFTHPPSEPTNYAKARYLLEANIRELVSLTPPSQFRPTQDKFLRGLRGELATTAEFERGKRTHNAVVVNNAEAKNVEAERVVREALAEGEAMLTRCKRSNFSC
jgi:hypothetical protein